MGLPQLSIAIFITNIFSIPAQAGIERCIPEHIQAPYQQKSMLPDYVKHDRNAKIHYFNDEERSALKLSIQNGKALKSEGTHVLPRNESKEMYVMDREGQFYVLPYTDLNSTLNMKHSSFLAAAPIASAGKLQFVEGNLVYIDTGSGHYQPSKFYLRQALASLVRSGVDISRASIAYGGNQVVAGENSMFNAVQTLFGRSASRCLRKELLAAKRITVTEFRTLRALGRSDLDRLLVELQKRGDLQKYLSELKPLFESEPLLKERVSSSVIQELYPGYQRKGRIYCALQTLRRLF